MKWQSYQKRVTVELNYSQISGGIECAALCVTNGYSKSSQRQAHLETYLSPKWAVVLACTVCGEPWSYCDNEAAISVLNSACSWDPQIMHLLCCLFFVKVHFEIEVKVLHIPGTENAQADAISCDWHSVFFSQVPAANLRPATVSNPLLTFPVDNQPDWISPSWPILFKNCF